MEKDILQVVYREEAPVDANILGGRFLFSIKNTETVRPVYKSHFFVQGNTDSENICWSSPLIP